jgi:hypothetical protein
VGRLLPLCCSRQFGANNDDLLDPLVSERGDLRHSHLSVRFPRHGIVTADEGGRALRVAIAMYRSRRTVQQRLGFREYDRAMPVPEIFQVRCLETDELVNAEACNRHTAAERRGSPTADSAAYS